MGDSRSWAAEQEEDEWRASPEYAKLCALIDRANPLLAKVGEIPLVALTVGDLQFLQGLPSSVYKHSSRHQIYREDVDKLEALLIKLGMVD